MQTEFHIDNFKPRRLKKSRLALEKYMLRLQAHANTNDKYKLGVFKEPTFLEKVGRFFK